MLAGFSLAYRCPVCERTQQSGRGLGDGAGHAAVGVTCPRLDPCMHRCVRACVPMRTGQAVCDASALHACPCCPKVLCISGSGRGGEHASALRSAPAPTCTIAPARRLCMRDRIRGESQRTEGRAASHARTADASCERTTTRRAGPRVTHRISLSGTRDRQGCCSRLESTARRLHSPPALCSYSYPMPSTVCPPFSADGYPVLLRRGRAECPLVIEFAPRTRVAVLPSGE